MEEILPPLPDKKTILRAEWDDHMRSIFVHRLARIAQRAGHAAELWDRLKAFEAADQQTIWRDTLGAGAWRTLRAIVYAFEALERWAAAQSPVVNVFPVQIEDLVRYLLHRERADPSRPYCPGSLPGALRAAIVSIYTRLQIKPLPDWESSVWTGQVKRIKNTAPQRDPAQNAVPMPPEFVMGLEDLVNEGSQGEQLFAGLFLLMIWCSLRFFDVVNTNPFQWTVEDAVIYGESRTKTRRIRKWVVANYSLGKRPWLIKWYRAIICAEPTDRDCILNSVIFENRGLRWTNTELQYDAAAEIFAWMVNKISKNAERHGLSPEKVKIYQKAARLHGLRATVISMAAEREEADRPIRFQGDWAQNSPMPDHYSKAKMAITLRLCGNLVKDLRAGWRPGVKADPNLLNAVEDVEEAPVNTTQAIEDSDADSDMALISHASISFYWMKSANSWDRRAHVPSAADPAWPACKQLRGRGIRIEDMVELGMNPTKETEICSWCRKARPEIGDLVADEVDTS